MFSKSTLLAFVSSLSAIAAVNAAAEIIFNPTITSPTSSTVWTVGTQVNVTWDTSDAPSQISNGGQVTLDQNGAQLSGVNPLASGFDLRAGFVTVNVPNVAAGSYEITLFGDSGNLSQDFSIVA